MPKRPNKVKVPIKLTSRDFNSIRRDLIEYAKRYYPDTYRDFNEAGFGSLMLDEVAYVGDILSFYLDYQANESFLDSAIEYNNIIRHGRSRGYRFRGRPSSTGIQTFFIIIPANTEGLGPDMDFVPILQRGSNFASTSGNQFLLVENVDFSNSNNEVVVAETDEETGIPISYAIKAHGRVISGELVEELVDVGEFQEFFRAELSAEDIAEIISVTDSEGHEYFEVDNLSQNVVYVPVVNRKEDKETAPNLLKPVMVPRRFVVEQDREKTFLQFGFGSQENLTLSTVVDPTDVVLNLHGREHITDDSFDPTKLMESDKFGVAPANTTLRVVLRRNTSENVNAAVDTVVEIIEPIFEFTNITNLDQNKVNDVINSLETTNEKSIVGDVELPNSQELKIRILDQFATQNRAVTREDYKSVVYNMPPQFGAVKRVNVVQDHDSFKRNLNMFVVSEDANGTLTKTTSTIKENLRTWLNRNKMINDTIDILDGTIVNIGIKFEIIAETEQNKYQVLNDATQRLIERLDKHMDISEPFSITNIFTILKEVDGLADVVKVKVVRKTGANYSDVKFNILENTSPDGRYVAAPENVIFEIKFPQADIVGSVS